MKSAAKLAMLALVVQGNLLAVTPTDAITWHTVFAEWLTHTQK